MKDENHVRWLYNQLPAWVSKGIITAKQNGEIRDHYGKIDENAGKKLAVLIFAIIGSILTALGVILVLAYNWSDIPKAIKIILAFTPLVLSIIFAGKAIADKKASPALRESLGIFWFLSVGGVIALLSQIYHISGSTDNFLLVWALLAFGIMYLLDSTIAALLYLLLITTWCPFAQNHSGIALYYWPLLALYAPFLVTKIRENRYSVPALWLAWLTIFSLSVSTGIVLEKCVPGLWMVIYAAYYTVLYLAGAKIYEEGANWAQKPFLTFGVCAIAILMLLFSYKWPWREIGWNYYRSGGRFDEFGAIQDYIFAVGLPIAALVLLYTEIKKKRETYLDFGLAFIVVLAAYAAASFAEGYLPAILIVFNLYTLYLSVRTIMAGVKRSRLDILNAGMVLFCALVISRFYDADMSLLARGIVFIILGAGFLGVNLFVANRKGASK